jgi:hypothetical protein
MAPDSDYGQTRIKEQSTLRPRDRLGLSERMLGD